MRRSSRTSSRPQLACLPVVAGLACCATAVAQTHTPIGNPFPTPIPLDGARVRLVPVAAGMTAPVWATSAPGLPNQLFVLDQIGLMYSINLATGSTQIVFDGRSRLVSLGIAGPGSYDERGLLGLAFHPNFATNGLLYTYESRPNAGPADFTTMPPGVAANHQSVITEWHMDPTGRSAIDVDSAREILRIDKPQFNHNAGTLLFGPDGYLYFTIGDGGQADDQGPGHNPDTGNAQDITVILGKIHRIDVNTRNGANGKYGIPPTNPFVGTTGLDEIYAYGLRNPFRFSFDDRPGGTGTLWLGDVGQNSIEEIDQIVAGGNYGWHVKEGSFLFDPNGNGAGFVYQDSPGSPPGMIDPVAQYDHDEGIAVIGGSVYRGGRIPALYGHYIFGDYALAFGGPPGRLFNLDAAAPFGIHGLRYAGAPYTLKTEGMGTDAVGNVYVLANGTGVPGDVTGVVLRVEAACPADYDLDGAITPADVATFINVWTRSVAAGTTEGDFDADGRVTPADVSAFVNTWFIDIFTGC